VPERGRDDALAPSLRGDPLHEEAGREDRVPDQPERGQDAPVETENAARLGPRRERDMMLRHRDPPQAWLSSDSVDRLPDLVADRPAPHPAHGEQIGEGDEDPVPDAVVALAGDPRPVRNRDLAHPEALHAQQGREEAMDALEEADVR